MVGAFKWIWNTVGMKTEKRKAVSSLKFLYVLITFKTKRLHIISNIICAKSYTYWIKCICILNPLLLHSEPCPIWSSTAWSLLWFSSVLPGKVWVSMLFYRGLKIAHLVEALHYKTKGHGSIPVGVFEMFRLYNPAGSTMTRGSTLLLTQKWVIGISPGVLKAAAA